MVDTNNNEIIKLNLGCASRPLPGYINIDMDDVDTLRKRYPDMHFEEGLDVRQYDIFALPFEDNTVSEVRADSLLEHLSFVEEKKIFMEVKRVLKKDGIFVFSVPNFEKIVKQWLDAEDDWREFFRNDPEAIRVEHWFGHYSYSPKSRWGYLTASVWGSQNGEGQLHKNCYTVGKIKALLEYIGFKARKISEFLWKGDRDPMIHVEALKK